MSDLSEQSKLDTAHPRVEDSLLQPGDGQYPMTRMCGYCLMCFPHVHVWEKTPWGASWR